MRIVIVFGRHETGKTTVLETIGRGLIEKGYTFSTLKDIHSTDFILDREGTDTFRHREAGALQTIAWGPQETGIIFPEKIKLDKILTYLKTDYLLIEGNLDIIAPKVLCVKNVEELNQINPLVIAISGVITNSKLNVDSLPVLNPKVDQKRLVDLVLKKSFEALPYPTPVNCKACNSNCQNLALNIISGKRRREDCPY